MSQTINIEFKKFTSAAIEKASKTAVVIVGKNKVFGEQAALLDDLCAGAIGRAVNSSQFKDAATGDTLSLGFPAGTQFDRIVIAKLGQRAKAKKARRLGAKLAEIASKTDLGLLSDEHPRTSEIVYGLKLRGYDFARHRSKSSEDPKTVTILTSHPKDAAAGCETRLAIANGVHFTRDLTNEPANILTTTEFSDRLKSLKSLGLSIDIIEENKMKKLEMDAFLGVGLGSETPSKMVIMSWNGGGDEPPLALVGKGVVFDTGGISLKPAGGMENMTMDMGGAGVVAGVMKSLALRKAKANVVGVVGLVENMPDGRAQRPGDVVTSMKGDTIEVINTDAEGRLVLCDVLWYVQQHLKPSGIIDLATLTGAAIIALGHENAAVFSNTSNFARKFLKSAKKEGEGAWRLPLGPGYDKQLKSRIADMKNVGGRPAGSVTAAQFLARFVEKDMPWIHLDIAGVASLDKPTDFAPAGATGWGVRAINRMISDYYE